MKQAELQLLQIQAKWMEINCTL